MNEYYKHIHNHYNTLTLRNKNYSIYYIYMVNGNLGALGGYIYPERSKSVNIKKLLFLCQITQDRYNSYAASLKKTYARQHKIFIYPSVPRSYQSQQDLSKRSKGEARKNGDRPKDAERHPVSTPWDPEP